MERRTRGFTLVEIMIVVAIIGILIAIAVPGFIRAREKSRTTACQENLVRIDQAIQQYVISNRISDTTSPLTVPLSFLVGEGEYMRNTPVCPSGGTYTLHAPDDSESVTCSVGRTKPEFPHQLPWGS